MLAPRQKSPEHRAAAARVEAWTRARFSLPPENVVLVTEIVCGQRGCPPLETMIAFWTDGAKFHHFKIFKPVAEVAEDDLPPRWMKPALVAIEGMGLECC